MGGGCVPLPSGPAGRELVETGHLDISAPKVGRREVP